jgi:imidazoleglycerol-phosphate dehydratase
MTDRSAKLERRTGETAVVLALHVDGARKASIRTGVGFFDHMLTLLAFHAGWNLDVDVTGDIEVDAHHTVEDTGIVLGRALRKAIGEGAGIARYGHAYVPLNESLGRAVVDICGRPHLEFVADFPTPQCGDFPVELVEEFMRSFLFAAGITAHLDLLRCRNSHHGAEVLFKALGRALATALQPTGAGPLSTKGTLAG